MIPSIQFRCKIHVYMNSKAKGRFVFLQITLKLSLSKHTRRKKRKAINKGHLMSALTHIMGFAFVFLSPIIKVGRSIFLF